MAARRSASALLSVALCLVAATWLLTWSSAFVSGPQASAPASVRGAAPAEETLRLDQGMSAAVLGAALAAPEAAHAANQGYALLQLGWAVFIIGLGPAVLFWIYFNKPEIL
eukprot:TRINITY_DN283_c0_g2_i1.p2 TRINITY_DN283_c0_g2~~TRINITY_DN283_c0_g2_i1.p2  ORF type:complete len:111 (-),score=23.72 TRINITY_DN283_c0_g2_i1:116-448(-)